MRVSGKVQPPGIELKGTGLARLLRLRRSGDVPVIGPMMTPDGSHFAAALDEARRSLGPPARMSQYGLASVRTKSSSRSPLGRRLALDGEKWRLWVVCPKCLHWPLTPLEEGWEAIDGNASASSPPPVTPGVIRAPIPRASPHRSVTPRNAPRREWSDRSGAFRKDLVGAHHRIPPCSERSAEQ